MKKSLSLKSYFLLKDLSFARKFMNQKHFNYEKYLSNSVDMILDYCLWVQLS